MAHKKIPVRFPPMSLRGEGLYLWCYEIIFCLIWRYIGRSAANRWMSSTWMSHRIQEEIALYVGETLEFENEIDRIIDSYFDDDDYCIACGAFWSDCDCTGRCGV